jgi:hypothetical protein
MLCYNETIKHTRSGFCEKEDTKMKKLITTMLVFCVVLALLVVGASAAYTDVKAGDWFEEAVLYCQENGLMDGIGGDLFDPDGTTTRGMMVTVLWRLAGKPASDGVDFTDVKAGAYYADAVAWASGAKIVEGYGDGKFGPDDLLTREQLVTILFRYAKSTGYDVSVGEETNILSYDDAFSVSEWAIPAMQWACGDGMIQGIGTNLEPQGIAQRAQLAVVLNRYAEKAEEAPAAPVDPIAPIVHFHVYSYNGDGTHTRCCDAVISDCVINTQGKCDLCGHRFVAANGAEYYDSVSAAVAAAAEGDTIQLFAGTYGTFTFTAATKANLTIVGGEGVYVERISLVKTTNYGAPAGLTLKNITFNGKGVDASGKGQVTNDLSIVDCDFVNGAYIHLNGDCTIDGLTVEDCTFTTTPDGKSAILVQGSAKNVKISNNTITNASWNAVQLAKTVGNVEISGNIISGTGSRAIRLSTKDGTVLTVTGNRIANVNLNPEEAALNAGQVLKVSGTVTDGTFTGNTYSVKMDESRDGRQVYCVVTDAYGKKVSTNIVTLTMK